MSTKTIAIDVDESAAAIVQRRINELGYVSRIIEPCAVAWPAWLTNAERLLQGRRIKVGDELHLLEMAVADFKRLATPPYLAPQPAEPQILRTQGELCPYCERMVAEPCDTPLRTCDQVEIQPAEQSVASDENIDPLAGKRLRLILKLLGFPDSDFTDAEFDACRFTLLGSARAYIEKLLKSVAPQPATSTSVASDTALGELYAEFDRRSHLPKSHDDHICIDDTQIGIEFAFEYLKGFAPAKQSVASDEREAFEKAMNDARFFPRELSFIRCKSPSGRDEYENAHLQSSWLGWQARAALAPQLPRAAVPDGWKLVPLEPTSDMNTVGFSKMLEVGKRQIAEIFKAMIAAAPQPQQDEGGE